MKILVSLLLSCSVCLGQVTKEVRYYTITDAIQQPINFFPGNVFAGANISIATNSLGQITITGSGGGGGTNILVRTNSIDLANSGTLNFVSGITGYVSAGNVFLGVNAAIISGSADADFGAAPGSDIATIVITGQTTITTNSYIIVRKMAIATSDHSDFDAVVSHIDLTTTAATAGTGFTIYAMSRMGRLTGKYRIQWSWFN